MHMWIIYQCNQDHWTERSKCINSNRGKGGKIHGNKVNKANDRGSRYRLNHGGIYEPDRIVFPTEARCQQFLHNDSGSVVFRIH
jgi:hypothetical protein